MKANILLSIFFLSLIAVSCKKKQDHYLIANEFKQWTVFHKASYWIYKNEKTNLIDSTYLPNDPEFWQFSISEVPTDALTLNFNSSFLNIWSVEGGPEGHSELRIMDTYNETRALSTELIENPKYYIGTDHSYGVVDVFPYLVINNTNFENVYHSRYAILNTSNDSVIKDYYFAKNIGLVKYEKRIGQNDTVWSLLRYKIFQ